MKLAGIQDYSLRSGQLDVFHADLVGDDLPSDTGLSENERFHVDSHRAGHPGSLTLVLDFPYAVDRVLLERLPEVLLSRHDILRTYISAEGDDLSRREIPLSSISVSVDSQAPTDLSDAEMTELVLARIAMACNPTKPLSHFFAAVLRPDTTTVICAFDHVYVDARSLTVLAADISDVVAGRQLSSAGSGLAAVRAHLFGGDVAPDDPRLAGWFRFLDESDWEIPAFPLDLGLEPGRRAPMRTRVSTLLGRSEALHFSSAVHKRGARTFSALLTCIGRAIRLAGGPADTAMIVPAGLQTSESIVAWVVANIPLRVHGGGDVVELLPLNAHRLSEALPLASVGLTAVYQTFGSRLRSSRGDVFMVSYVDYTRQRQPSKDVAVQQLSGDHATDNVQWWLWRDDDGIHARVRYPATAAAESVVGDVLEFTGAAVREISERLVDQRTSVGASPSPAFLE